MILNTEILIDGAEVNCDVTYYYFKEGGQVTINIEAIMCNSIEVSNLIDNDTIEKLNDKCERHYENYKFNEIESLLNKTWYGLDNSQKEL